MSTRALTHTLCLVLGIISGECAAHVRATRAAALLPAIVSTAPAVHYSENIHPMPYRGPRVRTNGVEVTEF